MALIWLKVLLLLSLTALLESSYLQTCLRKPRKVNMPKTPGDGNFEIEISGNPDKYMPGDMYTIKIKSKITENNKPKFKEFLLIVETTNDRYFSQRSVGTFQLFHSQTSVHSEDCPNAVIQASHILKPEIEVLWGAPPAGSGCLKFKAMVVEQHDVWYKDDGELTKEFCEERQDEGTMQPETIKTCCTCDEAKYEVTFDGMWSRQTHPKDFPTNQWLTHFSDIIGASHSNNYNMWRYGGLASPGLTQVAEWGSTRTLESELKKESKNIRTIIKARGLWYPNVNSKTFAVFRVDRKHHLMSLVSMLGPSPDWFVGVSDLELCLSNCTWIEHKTINLFPWDAGTDSGISYLAANQDTVPRQKIKRISNSEPNNQKSPFFDPKPKKPMKPLAKLTITRQRVYEKKCLFDDKSPTADYDDPDEIRPECALHDWSPFPPCPVTCGDGIIKRYRTYLNPSKAVQFQCKRQTEQGEMCQAPTPCPNGRIPDNPNCLMSEWENWSPCSASCGQGVQTRSRHYMSRYGLKQCFENLYDERICKTEISCNGNEGGEIDPSCSTTKWSRWSPCSASCGQGIMKRYRYFFRFNATERECGVKTEETRNCQGIKADCFITREEAIEICKKEQDPGPCRGYFTRYYFDPVKKSCRQFVFGGCKGNQNNFKHLEECNEVCSFSEDPRIKSTSYDENNSYFGGLTPESQLRLPVDCVASKWSEMSECSVTCGRGWKEQRRTIQVEPQFGGKTCPKKMIKRRKCKLTRCNKWNKHNLKSSSHKLDFNPYSRDHYGTTRLTSPLEKIIQKKLFKEFEGGALKPNEDCVIGEWSPWSPCTHSCGPEALQQRDRSIVVKARGNGKLCGSTLERRYCTLPPCPRRG